MKHLRLWLKGDKDQRAVPRWAKEVICHLVDRCGITLWEVHWRRNRWGGEAYGLAVPHHHAIWIWATGDREDTRACLIHELGHIMAGPQPDGHGEAFQKALARLEQAVASRSYPPIWGKKAPCTGTL